MPYKDPERKRQWEREHREERNARRRAQPLNAQIRAMPPMAAPEPISGPKREGNWKSIGALVVSVGVVLFAALAGVPVSANLYSSKRGPKNL